MPRTPTKPADTDPLADLRGDVDGSSALRHALPDDPAPTQATPHPDTPATPQVDAEPVLDVNAQVLVVVQAWHRDLTAQSFGHSGGTCGCAYLARKAVQALHG